MKGILVYTIGDLMTVGFIGLLLLAAVICFVVGAIDHVVKKVIGKGKNW